jgi:F-type H+-transporting ATPase subunit epsilon
MSDETNQLRVRLVTPERTLFEHAASAVELPGKSGYMEVLYGLRRCWLSSALAM